MTSSSSIPSCRGHTGQRERETLPELLSNPDQNQNRLTEVLPLWESGCLRFSDPQTGTVTCSPGRPAGHERNNTPRGSEVKPAGLLHCAKSCVLIPVSGCRTLSASLDASSFSPWSGFRCCPANDQQGAAFQQAETTKSWGKYSRIRGNILVFLEVWCAAPHKKKKRKRDCRVFLRGWRFKIQQKNYCFKFTAPTLILVQI